MAIAIFRTGGEIYMEEWMISRLKKGKTLEEGKLSAEEGRCQIDIFIQPFAMDSAAVKVR